MIGARSIDEDVRSRAVDVFRATHSPSGALVRKPAPRRSLLFAAVIATTIAGAAISLTPALAGTGTSTITGHLTDPSGKPAAGAFVWTQTPDMSSSASTTTDAAGAYSIAHLPAGSYKV